MIFLNVTHDPIAQATFGLVGESISNPDISWLALLTFGFLWNDGNWVSCDTDPSTTWTVCSGFD